VERQDFKVVKCTVCCRDKHEDLYCCSHWPKYSRMYFYKVLVPYVIIIFDFPILILYY
jgi:hypothetical protein